MTLVELTLPADDDYIIQIRALSEGGGGTPTEPINIHKLSKISLFIIKGEPFHFTPYHVCLIIIILVCDASDA